MSGRRSSWCTSAQRRTRLQACALQLRAVQLCALHPRNEQLCALCRYLSAAGMGGLAEVEWALHRAAALAEFEEQRGQHEAVLREAGHSGFFNARVGGSLVCRHRGRD